VLLAVEQAITERERQASAPKQIAPTMTVPSWWLVRRSHCGSNVIAVPRRLDWASPLDHSTLAPAAAELRLCNAGLITTARAASQLHL